MFLSSEKNLTNTFGVFKNPPQTKECPIQNYNTKETKGIVKGEYGKTPDQISQDVKEKYAKAEPLVSYLDSESEENETSEE